jgi:hypothetical protein
MTTSSWLLFYFNFFVCFLFRRDLAVREERRRELEFLEKVVLPLDFTVHIQQVFFLWYIAVHSCCQFKVLSKVGQIDSESHFL